MTTSIVDLTSAITKDSQDAVLEQEIRDHREEILAAIKMGHDYVLKTKNGVTLVFRAGKSEKSAKSA